MQKVMIYTKDFCPFCNRAKMLLKGLKVEFNEIDTTNDPSLRKLAQELSGGLTTMPQIFIGNESIGGYDNLHKLHSLGKLIEKIQK